MRNVPLIRRSIDSPSIDPHPPLSHAFTIGYNLAILQAPREPGSITRPPASLRSGYSPDPLQISKGLRPFHDMLPRSSPWENPLEKLQALP